jgi:hypothetical protein
MSNQTIAKTNSIQNRRISETGEFVNLDKAFSVNFIESLKDQNHSANSDITFINRAVEVNIDNKCVSPLGESPFIQYSNFYTQAQKNGIGTIVNNRVGEVNIDNKRISTLGESPLIEYSNFYTQTQSWVGTIINIEDDGFEAKLEDRKKAGTYEIADFQFDEISKEDKPLINVGAVFYWSVGYANDRGQVKKESIIRFQRLPQWTPQEIDIAVDRSKSTDIYSEWL